MKRKLPPLNSLRSFEAIGRHGSIAGAARELDVTEPAVSRALKNLENHFGVSLFHRHTRGLALSEHGKILLPEITHALDQVAKAAGRVYEQSRYSLSILATPMIASRWIAPIISDFMRAHQDISVHLHSSFRSDEIQSYDFHIAIWNSESDHPNCDRQHLLSVERIPICSAELAATVFAENEISALQEASLLHEYDFNGWIDWFEDHGLDPHRAASGFVSDNFGAILQATINNAGVALLFETYLDDPLFGHLIAAPFGRKNLGVPTDYWLYSNTSIVDDKPVRKMRDFLLERLGN